MLEPACEKFYVLGSADFLFPGHASWFTVFLEAMALEPELIERYFEATTTSVLDAMDAQVGAGVDGFNGGTDIAHHTTTLISPNMFRRFIFPQLRRITERCHEHSVPFFKHTDGNIENIEKELLLECGVDGYHHPGAGRGSSH